MKYVKILGLAAVAAMALAAFVGVASASAATEFHQTQSESVLHGAQMTSHVFTVEGSEVTCTNATFEGKAGAPLSEPTQTVHPEYTGCTAFSIAGATINTAGCKYTFSASTTLAGGTEAPVSLTGCTAGFVNITVEAPFGLAKCVVHVPNNQTSINGQKYVNQVVGTKHVVEVITNSTNIEAEVITSTGFCPLKVTGKKVASVYKGTSTVEGNGGASALSWS
jgi:hypothetical protein